MISIAQGPHRDRVEEDDRPVVSISRGATKGYSSGDARRPKSDGDHGHGRGKEFDFHVVSVVRHGHRRHHRRDRAVNRVKTRHDAAVSRVRIRVCGVEGVPAGRWSGYCVDDAREIFQCGIHQVHIKDKSGAAIRSNCGG